MAQSGNVPRVDPALETVVAAINDLPEAQDDGPGVVLTLGGLVISGTVIPDWQWFDEVEHAARACGCPKLHAQPMTCSFVRGRWPGMIRW